MSREEFNHILDQIKGFTQHIYFHVQGEPLTHPELIHFLDDCYVKGFKVHLVTNGTLLKNYTNDLFTHPALAQLSVSLHTSQMNTNDNNYKVLKNLVNESEILDTSLFLRLWSLQDNNSIKLINSLISPIQIQFNSKRTQIKKNLFVDLDEQFEWPNPNQPFQSFDGKCHSGTKMLAILSNGDVSPCCLDADGLLSIGNIYQSSLNQILENNRFINFINGFKKRQCVETLCQGCTYRLRFNK
jgi:radical SAM protein with 4Fe4S-binding SPASM domain